MNQVEKYSRESPDTNLVFPNLSGNLLETLEFFDKALETIVRAGYKHEIDYVETRKLSNITPEYFLSEYVFVALSAGMRNQVVQLIFKTFVDSGYKTTVIGHPSKRRAIETAMLEYKTWFNRLKSCSDWVQIHEYLQSLPWIGKVTVYHLMRNLGIDVVKPDRWLVRLAKHFKFESPHKMCEYIASQRPYRIGTVDVIVWRMCNAYPSIVRDMLSMEEIQITSK